MDTQSTSNMATSNMATSNLAEFGFHALPPHRERLRQKADVCGYTVLAQWLISWYRKRAFKDLPDPFDVTIMPGVRARLWPRSNRCEKRAFAGVHIWDRAEHTALRTALLASESSPFVFIDAGANVGLYSLILSAKARAANKAILILAIEPDSTNRGRLEFNIKASGADIEVLPFAISGQEGEGVMVGGDTNRGEVHLTSKQTPDQQTSGQKKPTVPVRTLYGICHENDLSRIDAMKMDIEGHDEPALRAFFASAPQSLWPKLMVLETGRETTTPLLELCQANGYTLNTRTGINSVLSRTD